MRILNALILNFALVASAQSAIAAGSFYAWAREAGSIDTVRCAQYTNEGYFIRWMNQNVCETYVGFRYAWITADNVPYVLGCAKMTSDKTHFITRGEPYAGCYELGHWSYKWTTDGKCAIFLGTGHLIQYAPELNCNR